MIISVHNKCPATLTLFLITAASLFLPVLAQQSAVTIKETNSPLESRKLQYTFDPSSPLTSYTDHGACGARGDDAQADLSQCIWGSKLVADEAFSNAADVPNIDGCNYFAYKIWECLPAPTADPSETPTGNSCVDAPGWIDSYGDSCSWYENYGEISCDYWGSVVGTDANGNSLMTTEACCFCGGGE